MALSRRSFLVRSSALAFAATFGEASAAFAAGPADYRRLLVLVELKGGNDGLNTVVPYADRAYASLRPKIGIARDEVVQLTDRIGLHPALAPLEPIWQARELAILQGVGYPRPNLSHFRSIEIWDTASSSDEYRAEGWLARAIAAHPAPRSFAADGVVVGANDLGPLSGPSVRTIALNSTEQFVRQARLADPHGKATNEALAHLLKVEADIAQAGERLEARHAFATTFPASAFGYAVHTAAQVIANPSGVAAVRLSLTGFDTHANQVEAQARLLGQIAQGLAALRAALQELSRWNDTLVLTYSEFGRRPKQNLSNGTDHGTANVHFALGGRIAGGLYGARPELRHLDEGGNLGHAIDFREVYATALERWWDIESSAILGGRFTPVPFVRT